ncbi:MAG: hypothetical protein LBV20_07155 [Treponema sp.]|jgi:hypothetical protein|nr:hypothetical protein [Treponema sp.]
MNQNSAEFYLPLGLIKDGKVYRKGKMRLATTRDELEIQDDENIGFNARYRDILLLSKVIEELEGLSPVTSEMIESLFEVDFLYLQILYKEIHSEIMQRISAECPCCGKKSMIRVPSLYSDMDLYKENV